MKKDATMPNKQFKFRLVAEVEGDSAAAMAEGLYQVLSTINYPPWEGSKKEFVLPHANVMVRLTGRTARNAKKRWTHCPLDYLRRYV
uniref:Uncharacterized protein n=1 Tax=viral metagenome TaxID=1070528 RepID=A0A6H1ZL45_9ZZZZ